MKGFFSLELFLVLLLVPYLLYLTQLPELLLPRETIEIAQDFAQAVYYGFSPEEMNFLEGKFTVWVNGTQYFACNYSFRYCTFRIKDQEEVQICLAECLQ
mgnify:CR=1 FL=1